MSSSSCHPAKTHLLLLLLSFLTLGALLSACGGPESKGQGAPGAPGGGAGGLGAGARKPVMITAAAVERRDVPLQIPELIGTVEPIANVTVKARIGGALEKVHFAEGDEVKQGDLLFTIDRRPLEADLRQAEANLARDQAQAANAQRDLSRYEGLSQRGAVSPSDYEKIRTTFQALEATVRAEQAAVESAKLQLGYTEIRSPITGRTGRLLIKEGNLVKANDSDLVTINQITPIYVSFSVDENRLPEIRRAMADHPLTVSVKIANDTDRPDERGTLTFINNTVTPGTGQIQLRATFPNKEARLWPGLYVKATLELTTQKNAIVIPATALQTGQQGDYAMVIKPDMNVEARPVTIDRQVGAVAVIAKGLATGEQVVTDGQLMIDPGKTQVQIKGGGGPRGGGAPGADAAATTATARAAASKGVKGKKQ